MVGEIRGHQTRNAQACLGRLKNAGSVYLIPEVQTWMKQKLKPAKDGLIHFLKIRGLAYETTTWERKRSVNFMDFASSSLLLEMIVFFQT